ncbi:MAG: aminotransferase class III-fold pyridoxal phosphate-dependent enzyme [Firmicutes bacterium]|nr:aminotransferase class III-fold pyridoxal phosphate-dependent enzyme [Bacillota bacterium]
MVNRDKLKKAYAEELELFHKLHPTSIKNFESAKDCLLQGVPLNWMVRYAGGIPLTVKDAKGVHLTDADGIDYIDFCLGDTGSMVGHSPEPFVEAMADIVKHGTSHMLPTEDATWNARELTRRFGVKYWQFSTSATDANRFAIRLARQITKRPKVIVFNWCYHGTVDETIATLTPEGKIISRLGNIGPQIDPSYTTKVIEWNDVEALENALKDEDVAVVMAEPVMTNIGIVHPAPGYHQKLRELTRKYGTYLLIDETHTICCGIGGYTRENNLDPDIVVCGKTLAGGIPVGCYGFTEEFAEKAQYELESLYGLVKGIGGTLAANAITMAAMHVILDKVLTEDFYKHAIPLAERFNAGVEAGIKEFGFDWSTTQLGTRTEYWFLPEIAKDGTDAVNHRDFDLDWYMHLYALNRGIFMTPFHNMAIMSAATSEADVDKHTEVFREACEKIAD